VWSTEQSKYSTKELKTHFASIDDIVTLNASLVKSDRRKESQISVN